MIVIKSQFLSGINPSDDIYNLLTKYLLKMNIKHNKIVDVLIFYKTEIKEVHNG